MPNHTIVNSGVDTMASLLSTSKQCHVLRLNNKKLHVHVKQFSANVTYSLIYKLLAKEWSTRADVLFAC